MNDIITYTGGALSNDAAGADGIDLLIEEVLKDLQSKASRKVYQDTYDQWKDWCNDHRLHPLNLASDNIRDFITSRQATWNTRHRMLSTMRTLVRTAADLDDRFERFYARVKRLKLSDDNEIESTRKLKALKPSEVQRVMSVWDGDSNAHVRNRALVAVLFTTGVRRFELAAIRWKFINFEDGTIHLDKVKGGKRKKRTGRDVAIAGDAAIEALLRWHERIPSHEWVFCGVNKGDVIGEDVALLSNAVYKIIKKTEKLSGVVFSPHDARRTMITEMNATGTPIADIQQQAGHVNASTTMIYMQADDAKTRRGKLRLRYGD